MNASLAYTLDSLFGPPSDPIDISVFLEGSSRQNLNSIREEDFTTGLVEECSVEDLHNAVNDVWSNPALSGYIMKDHDRTVTTLHAHTKKAAKAIRKTNNRDSQSVPTEVADLQKKFESIVLNSFRLSTDAVLFMRTPKNSDQNTLNTVKTVSGPSKTAGLNDALLVISVHSKVSWCPSYVTRTSQHAFISSQTLHDVFAAIPCLTRCFPSASGTQENWNSTGCIICIEGFAYGDKIGVGGVNYASRLFEQIEISDKKGLKTITKAPTSLEDTRLSSLSLRTNEPYWLIHQGNCEHFIVIDQIRVLHPLDPPLGYPLTLHITPPILDLCRACGRVPAVWSIVGDIRLGESPCLLCGPCWRNMGLSDIKDVVALSLPEYAYFS